MPEVIVMLQKSVGEIDTFDNYQLSYYARNMREVFNHQSVDLCAPQVKSSTKGRSHVKKGTSTRWNLQHLNLYMSFLP